MPPAANAPHGAKLAIASVSGDAEIAAILEQSILAQRPAASADIAIFTSQQLLEASPVRLASTTALSNQSSALAAARAAGADIVLLGEILQSNISLDGMQNQPQTPVNMNHMFFARNAPESKDNFSLLLGWHAIDVHTGKTIGSQTFQMTNRDVLKQYPDLAAMNNDAAAQLLTAAARESWKTVAPYVTKDNVRLATPILQPGSLLIFRGNRAAKLGQWQLAEQYWQRSADRWWFNPAADHNLAVAKAAKEDFESAKEHLSHATGPLSIRLPHETLFWLDQQHRLYNEAHGLGEPIQGWSIPDGSTINFDIDPAEPIDVADLPWWTAIPLTKPPGWTWKEWLMQPMAL